MKAFSSTNVYDAALQRTVNLYKDESNRIIVAFSAGKDSGAVLEVCVEAARLTGRLPVEVWMRDEEIMYPGTYEYAERIANRPEIKFHWLWAGQPIVNIFNRNQPYFWVFDYQLQPSQWMREPPPFAIKVPFLSMEHIMNPVDFPPPAGGNLVVVMGVRASESRKRNMIIHMSGGEHSGSKVKNEKHFRPIYDWTTKDVWLAVKEKGWDFNSAYNTMTRFGFKRDKQRIAPPTMSVHGIDLLQMAFKAWPEWSDRLAERLPGIRLAQKYGQRALMPVRRSNETWEQAYQRINIDESPDWIKTRAIQFRDITQRNHSRHSNTPIMEVIACPTCSMGKVSWERMTSCIYFGDPFLLETHVMELGYVEPEDFRAGSGTWGGKPIF